MSLLTRKQIAARCGLSVRTIDDLISKSVLPLFKIGKSIRFDPAEVDAALREHFYRPSQGKAAKKTRRKDSTRHLKH